MEVVVVIVVVAVVVVVVVVVVVKVPVSHFLVLRKNDSGQKFPPVNTTYRKDIGYTPANQILSQTLSYLG